MVGRNWFGGSHSHNKCTSVSVCQSSRLVDEIQTSFQFESLSDRRRIKPGNSEIFNGLCEFRNSQTEEFDLPVDQVCLVFGSDKNALSIFFFISFHNNHHTTVQPFCYNFPTFTSKRNFSFKIIFFNQRET